MKPSESLHSLPTRCPRPLRSRCSCAHPLGLYPFLSIFRPGGVHAANRSTTRALGRLAKSALSSVSRPPRLRLKGSSLMSRTPLPSSPSTRHRPRLLPTSGDGLTCSSVLTIFGGREPRRITPWIGRAILSSVKRSGSSAAFARRLEVLWFGQVSRATWLAAQGWGPPHGAAAWRGARRSTPSQCTERAGTTNSLRSDRESPGALPRTDPQAFHDAGWVVEVVSGPGRELADLEPSVRGHPIPMIRDPRPAKDIVGLLAWCRLLIGLVETSSF